LKSLPTVWSPVTATENPPRAVGGLHGGDDRFDVGVGRGPQVDQGGVPPGRYQRTTGAKIGPDVADAAVRAQPGGQAGDDRPEGVAARGGGPRADHDDVGRLPAGLTPGHLAVEGLGSAGRGGADDLGGGRQAVKTGGGQAEGRQDEQPPGDQRPAWPPGAGGGEASGHAGGGRRVTEGACRVEYHGPGSEASR
jgi:hypothetical protein